MNTDIEWLFDEIFLLKKKEPKKELYFISDWDSEIEDYEHFKNLLNEAENNAQSSFFRYSFAYEQFDLKQQIISFCKSMYDLCIGEYSLSITPSSTLSIYLSLTALKRLNINRYLVFTPAYFSTFETLKNNSSFIFYYHLLDSDGFSIDFDRLESLIEEQHIECLVITDPIFSSGIELSISDYKRLSIIANKYDIYLVIDYSLGGLNWDHSQISILNYYKLREISLSKKYVFIDSLSKRLLLNGIKFSIVFADEDVIDYIDRIAEGLYGGLNSIQIEAIRLFYKIESNQIILEMQKKQLKKITANYELINTMLIDEPFKLATGSSGIFTIISSEHFDFTTVDAKKIILTLLYEDEIIAIPSNRFSYYKLNKFGWRINLAKNPEKLMINLQRCIRKVFSRLYH